MEAELERIVELLAANEWPFRIHATYDETIDRFLTVFERVNGRSPFKARFIIDKNSSSEVKRPWRHRPARSPARGEVAHSNGLRGILQMALWLVDDFFASLDAGWQKSRQETGFLESFRTQSLNQQAQAAIKIDKTKAYTM